MLEALTRHAQCWEKDEVGPSIVAAGVKPLASRSEITALDRVEAAWISIEEYFTFNAIIERVFQYSRGKFKNGPAHIITLELMGLHPPKFKTKAATALDMKRSWKEHPDLVYAVARKTRRLGRLLSRPISSAASVS